MAESLPLLKGEIARIARALHTAGWVANHDGNVSVRLPDGRILCTPTAVSKRLIATSSILTLDATGEKIDGDGRPFSELNLHLATYDARPDVCVVLHAHPPTATGLGVAGTAIDPCIVAEAVVSIGDEIPLIPYAKPGPDAAARVTEAIPGYNALVLANHGVVTVGTDLEQAFLRMELIEHLAKIQTAAMAVGEVKRIPQADIDAMLAKRKKAGLDPKTAAPKPQSPDPQTIERIVEAEIRRLLAG